MDAPAAPSLVARGLRAFGIAPRPYFALVAALWTMDLRGQHYSRATGTLPKHVLSPLFLVVGQCFTLSAVTSFLLFMRVDVFFFAFAGLATSLLVMGTAVLVEFSEIVCHPRDLDILGHRPISARTYAAARLTNLLIYIALIYTALNLFPLVLGCGLRDSGPWYAPAYLAVSLAGNLLVACGVIGLLSVAGNSPRFEVWKELCAWSQIVLILVVGYGGQMMFRDKTHAFEVWAAFPPDWVAWTPPAWLARIVERSAVGADWSVVRDAGAWLAAAGLACGALLARLTQIYRTMQPLARSVRERPRPPAVLGRLSAPPWMRAPETRAGWWLATTMLRRDVNLRIRCLLPLQAAVATIVLGTLTGQFANPWTSTEPRDVLLPILSVTLIAGAAPPILLQLACCDAHAAAWTTQLAPLRDPGRFVAGVGQAVQGWIITPACGVLGLAMWWSWGDPLAAGGHAAWCWLLAWTAGRAAQGVGNPAWPLSQPVARGAGLAAWTLPLLAISAALMLVAGIELAAGAQLWFWLPAPLLAAALGAEFGRRARVHWRRVWAEGE